MIRVIVWLFTGNNSCNSAKNYRLAEIKFCKIYRQQTFHLAPFFWNEIKIYEWEQNSQFFVSATFLFKLNNLLLHLHYPDFDLDKRVSIIFGIPPTPIH